MSYTPGATLVLYTDGLIERRTEDIDQGLHRLTASLKHHHTLPPEPLADAILTDLVPAPAGAGRRHGTGGDPTVTGHRSELCWPIH